MTLKFKPLTTKTWGDFVELFGEHGAYGGCWCMFWRLTRAEFSRGCGENNKAAMRALVQSGRIPGILAYRGGKAVGWVSVAPREDFSALERSRNLKRVDDQPVWSIVCFYAPKAGRGGMMRELIAGSEKFAGENGARIMEAYPSKVDKKINPAELYMGIQDTFLEAGYEVIERRGSRVIVRKEL